MSIAKKQRTDGGTSFGGHRTVLPWVLEEKIYSFVPLEDTGPLFTTSKAVSLQILRFFRSSKQFALSPQRESDFKIWFEDPLEKARTRAQLEQSLQLVLGVAAKHCNSLHRIDLSDASIFQPRSDWLETLIRNNRFTLRDVILPDFHRYPADLMGTLVQCPSLEILRAQKYPIGTVPTDFCQLLTPTTLPQLRALHIAVDKDTGVTLELVLSVLSRGTHSTTYLFLFFRFFFFD
jgi:hypothetical protein